MLPRGLAAVFAALRFDGPRLEALHALDDREWRASLLLCDRTQLTLPLADAPGMRLPGWVRERLAKDLRCTTDRMARVRSDFEQISQRLATEGIEVVVLKGFAASPAFVPDPRRRMQYDLDLFAEAGGAVQARDALLGLGYEPLTAMEEFPTDHLPTMIKKTGWQWRGDFFDPEIPLPVDLHFRLWDQETEAFPAQGWEDFWRRRVKKSWDGLVFEALAEPDALGYACLHLVRHLLRGSLRFSHAYELAWFLHHRAGDEPFWQEWQALHPDGLRRIEAVAFRLASEWFGCGLAEVARHEIVRLPDPVLAWFRRYSWSPVEALHSPNKHELWLHLSLIDSWSAGCRVVRRRLLPARLPGPVDAVFVPDRELTLRLRWRKHGRYAQHLAGRVWHHTRVLPSTVLAGVAWSWLQSAAGQLGPAYWRFLGAASLFNLGAFIFFLLYNLRLLDLGYKEDFLGLVTSAMTVGGVVGTLPAGYFAQRVGLRVAMGSCFSAMAMITAGRVLLTAKAPLIVLAFLAGLVFSIYAVIVAPAVAQLTDERNRPRAFSIFFATGISLGVAGGLLGGGLPALLGSKVSALMVGCTLIALAVIPTFTLNFPSAPAAERQTFPRGSFIRRFLLVIAAWSLATGAFNPFFNVFFARQIGATVPQIGLVYSAAQLAQVAAILLAPFLLRRAGIVRGVAISQIACGLALALLGILPGVAVAGAAYAAYMGFHYMGEPGLYSLLMNRVPPSQQRGASSLNHLAMSAAQAVAAAIAGAAVTRVGYGPVIALSAVLASLAGLLLWRLLPENPRD